MSHRKQLTRRRVGHKSTGGILPSIPEPVDPVGNAAPLKSNTVAFRLGERHDYWFEKGADRKHVERD